MHILVATIQYYNLHHLMKIHALVRFSSSHVSELCGSFLVVTYTNRTHLNISTGVFAHKIYLRCYPCVCKYEFLHRPIRTNNLRKYTKYYDFRNIICIIINYLLALKIWVNLDLCVQPRYWEGGLKVPTFYSKYLYAWCIISSLAQHTARTSTAPF